MEGIDEIYKDISKIAKDYLQFGETDLVKKWIKKVENWAEKNKDIVISSIVFGFKVWNSKDELKKLTIKIAKRYQTYLSKESKEKRIFIAHNDGEDIANDLRFYLSSKCCIPIIMQLEPNMGETIFDKFRRIKFDIAVVVLTEDKKFKRKTNVSRAKQNVILEIGYAYAQLKDVKKVFILYDGKAEIPSNITAIEYIKIDKNWKSNLQIALKARGLIKFKK